MIRNIVKLKQRHKEIKKQCDASEDDYTAFEEKKQMLTLVSKVENSAMVIYDMYKDEFIFLHWQFDESFHFDYRKNNSEAYWELLNPNDLPFVLETEIKAYNFIKRIPSEEKKDYKLIYEYRLRDASGIHHHFLHQTIVLELDRNRDIWLFLLLIDLIVGKISNDPIQRMIVNLRTGKSCLFNNRSFLSHREIEILGLISQGLDSHEISDKLFISVNTVNNHRHNILSKTKTETTIQASYYAKRIGII